MKTVEEVFQKKRMVNYFDKLTKKVGLFESEKIVFEKYVKKDDGIVDIGCGTGRTTIGLYQLGYTNIVGVDISSEMIKRCRTNTNEIEFKVCDIVKTDFLDNNFDCAFFSFNGLMLISHLENRIRVLREINRILKDNGLFIFSTPYLDNKMESAFWRSRRIEFNNHVETEKFGDIILEDLGINNIFIHIPFMAEVKKCLQETGYDILECTPRMKIALENKSIESFLDDNLYWIARKYRNEKD